MTLFSNFTLKISSTEEKHYNWRDVPLTMSLIEPYQFHNNSKKESDFILFFNQFLVNRKLTILFY